MTDWNSPVSLTLPVEITPFNRMASLLGHYDFRVYVRDDAYMDIGAGSLPVIDKIHLPPGSGLLATVGRFCEVNETARIHAGGEHDHDQPVNNTFTGFPAFRHGIPLQGIKRSSPVVIGSGVIVSAGAIVLAETSIGDGAVIGAGAVVTRPVEPFGIYAGVPARKLRSRPAFAPWWDFEVAYLLENKHRLNELASDQVAQHRYRKPRPPFALKMAGGGMNLVGFVNGDRLDSFSAAPRSVRDYIVQAVQSDSPYWLADCWAESEHLGSSAA